MATKRRRSAMVEIQDEQSKQVTFSKRRKTLFNKAAELALLTGAQVAIIAFSPGGRPFVFGHPSVDDLVDAYLATSTTGMSSPSTFPRRSEEEAAETIRNLHIGCDLQRGIQEEKFMNLVVKEYFKIGDGVDRDQCCESVVLASCDRDRVSEELKIDDDMDRDDQYCDLVLFSDDEYREPVLFSDDGYGEPLLFSDDRYREPLLFSDDLYCGPEVDRYPLIEEQNQFEGESPSLKDDDGFRVEYFPRVDEDAAFEYLQFDDNYAFDLSVLDYFLWDQDVLF